jgi:hypothetical protein
MMNPGAGILLCVTDDDSSKSGKNNGCVRIDFTLLISAPIHFIRSL